MTILDKYSNEEFINIVKNSNSYSEVLHKLGYSYHSGTSYGKIKSRINELNIDISHFYKIEKINRNPDNIFIKDSTVTQSTLRRYYKKGNYTSYICSICGQKPIWQNKELTLILDHINGENRDDRLENLRWVCPNCNAQLDTTYRNKIIKKKYYCIDCKKEILPRSKRCNVCEAEKRKSEYIKNLPVTRNELKILIKNKSFCELSKIYNVSDKTISYWCKIFNLPFKKSDIKKYSDKEWERI